MVFRARQTYDDVQLARMEDPLPDGPWDLVISVLSVNDLTDEQKQSLFRRVREQSRSLVIGDAFEAEQLENVVNWCGGEIAWQADDLAVVRAVYRQAENATARVARGGGRERSRCTARRPPPRDRTRAPSDPATIPRPMAVPKKRTSSARRDKRRATHKAGEGPAEPVPALPQPAPAAPGLPDLRHLRRA